MSGASVSVSVVQAQLEAYNAQDLDAFAANYAEDVIIADVGGAVTTEGRETLVAKYAEVFKKFPQNKVNLAHRIVIGAEKVLDHEEVLRDGEAVAFEVVAIYTVKNGLIQRVDFVK